MSAPSSKSVLQRYIVAAMLAKGKSVINFQSISDDAKHVLNIANQLCMRAKIVGSSVVVDGGIVAGDASINVGESGLGLRMLIPILCTTGNRYEISGTGSLLGRPIDFVLQNLRATGAKLSSNDGNLPIFIHGGITEERFKIDASISSQLLTGLLMAAPLLNRNICIEVANLKSRPYIDLTISVLQQFGIELENINYEKFLVKSGQEYQPACVGVEGDWSGAAFILVAAAIAGKVKVKGISKHSKQGDKQIVDILQKVGTVVQQFDNEVIVEKDALNSFEFDSTDTPDLFPPLVALAVHCTGVSKIKGISRLTYKESNRASSLQSEFAKLGAKIELSNDYMLIKGGKLRGNTVTSYNDHRLAMALATAALSIDEKVLIENSEAVSKSWVDFFDKFKNIGANVSFV